MAFLPTGYNSAYVGFRARSNFSEKFTETLQTMKNDEDSLGLRATTSCISFGTGSGRYELESIALLMPGLRSFTAVEPDAASAAELRLNVQRHLPNVSAVVHQMTTEEFVKSQAEVESESAYDVVLLFSILYYVDEGDRKLLYRKLVEDLGRTFDKTGKVLVINRSRTDHPECMMKMAHELDPNCRTIPSSDDIEREFSEEGFSLCRQYEFQFWQDFTDPDTSILTMFSLIVRRPVELEEMRRAISAVWKNWKTEESYLKIMVFNIASFR